jgi:hypothetical protein
MLGLNSRATPNRVFMIRQLFVLSAFTAAALAQQPLTFGNLVVVRVGDGTAALSNAATATFLDEYTSTGTLVQTIALPTAVNGLNQPFSNSGTATSEGFLNLSQNGVYLTLAGYATAPGPAAIATSPASVVPRVIARIDLGGGVDTSTTITDGYNGVPPVPPATSGGTSGNIRSAATVDGTAYWCSGTGATAAAGVRYVQHGANTSLGLNAGAPSNVRVAGIYNGQLYATSASTVYQSVCAVGTGLPTTIGQSVSVLPGLPAASGPSAYDFWFADPQTLYIADDRATSGGGGGGVQKWVNSNGTWALQYILQPTTGCRAVSGRRVNGTTTVYATTANGQLVSFVDNGVGSPATVVATAPANTAFRGLRVISKPSTLTRLPAACGTTGIQAAGNGEVGTDVVTTIAGAQGIPFVGYGVTFFNLPFCGCFVVHDFLVLSLGSQATLSIPNNPALFGFALYIQGVDLGGVTGCQDPLLALTDGYALTIQ